MNQPYDLPLEELQQYKPSLTKQPDFDNFWASTLKQLAEVPLQFELIPYDYPVKNLKVYRCSYLGFHHANIAGWLAIPDSPGPHPGLVMYHGYNWSFDGNLHDTVNLALHGYAVLHMLVRGQQGDSTDNVISTHGNSKGWMTKGILSPESYYYRAVYMDAVRAVEILSSLDKVDPKRIGVIGGSQGGALSLASAALSDIPKIAIADFPFLCHFNRAIDIAPNEPYTEINEYFRRNSDPKIESQAKLTLSYFDIMNHAPSIKCHTLMSVGLVDDITPPSTVFAAYNHLACSKELGVFRYFGHEYIPGFVEKKLTALLNMLG